MLKTQIKVDFAMRDRRLDLELDLIGMGPPRGLKRTTDIQNHAGRVFRAEAVQPIQINS